MVNPAPTHVARNWSVTAEAIHAQRRERVRQRIVRLILVIYFLLVFEGVIRKWLLPQAEQLIYFIRVPFALWLYFIVLWHGAWPKFSFPFAAASILAIAAMALIPIQLVTGGYPAAYLLVAGYGWMNYFFYIPLAFLIAEHFRHDDLDRLIRLTLIFALINAPLMMAQFEAPSGSVLNVGSADEGGENKFASHFAAFGHVRPTGFFTSDLGQGTFIAGVAAMVLCGWLQERKSRPFGRFFLLSGTVALLTMFAVSQNRSAALETGVILLTTAAAGLITGRKSAVFKSVILPFLVIVLAAVVWPLLFPEAYETFVSRVSGAAGSEATELKFGSFGRILFQFYAWTYHLGETPVAGFLLGIAGSVSYTLSWVRHPRVYDFWVEYGGWGEDAWSRHIIELGPIIGILFIVFRLYLAVWLGRLAVSATLKSREAAPLIWWGLAVFMVTISLIAGHGTVSGFGWMYFGFSLAAARIYSTRPASQMPGQGRSKAPFRSSTMAFPERHPKQSG